MPLKANPMPSAIFLERYIEADFETGVLTWKPRCPEDFPGFDRSPEHACKVWNSAWAGKEAVATEKNGYRVGALLGIRLAAHRVYKMAHGVDPIYIDHINGVRTDNRVSNLRSVSALENNKNASIRKDNSSGVVGISWNAYSNKWQAYISSKGNQKHIGYFDTRKAAIAARHEAERQFAFHPNHGKQKS